MQAFVPKTRKPKFELNLRIIDLNNVPLVSGTSLVKWHLPHSASAEHRGRTSKQPIRDHKVAYHYTKTLSLRLTTDRNAVLQDVPIMFEILQEYNMSGRSERINLGNVRLNLAEYADVNEDVAGEAADEHDSGKGVLRRYLMQDSKVNSTIKIGIYMKLIEGERNFISPPLKTAPVFGNIAGVLTADQGDSDDIGNIPSLSSKSREHSETQDMYRRNLAAFWTAQPGELKADECIENIFAGGSGWEESPEDSESYNSSSMPATQHNKHKRYNHRHSNSRDFDNKTSTSRDHPNRAWRKSHDIPHRGGVSGRSGLEHHANNMKAEVKATGMTGIASFEVNEFELREDLKSWTLPGE